MKTLFFLTRNALIIVSLMLLAAPAHAMKAPDQVVKETVDSMVAKLQQNRAEYTADNTVLYAMLEQTLIPALNVNRMADLILDKEVSKSASPAQKQAFIKEFKTNLLRTYATGLLNASGEEKVIYEPINMAPGADRVKVKATLVSSTGSSYPIVLSMTNKDDTQWRAYNIEVVGINVIRSYRLSYAATLQQKGIDGLIADLRAKNNT